MVFKGCVKSKVLVVDDEPEAVELVEFNLKGAGYEVATASDGAEALNKARRIQPNLVILDIWLNQSRIDVLGFLTVMMRVVDDLPVLMISGHCNIETAVAAIKNGAYDFIEKPFLAERLLLTFELALEVSRVYF